MLKIKDDVDLKELEKFGFIHDNFFTMYHRPIYEDYIEQFQKKEYLLVNPKSLVLIKGKICCILDTNGKVINGYEIKTNRIKKYVQDLITAGLVEKVDK